MQAARERLHREGAVKSAQAARCSVCHLPVFRDGMKAYLIDRRRWRRVCLGCAGKVE